MWELRRHLVVLKTGVTPKIEYINRMEPLLWQTAFYEVTQNLFLDTTCHFHQPPFLFYFLPLLLLLSTPNPPPHSIRLSVWVCFLCHRLQDVLYKQARFQSQRKKASKISSTETSRSMGKQRVRGWRSFKYTLMEQDGCHKPNRLLPWTPKRQHVDFKSIQHPIKYIRQDVFWVTVFEPYWELHALKCMTLRWKGSMRCFQPIMIQN